MGARWGIVAVARHRRLRSALVSSLDGLLDRTHTTPPAVRILQEVKERSLVPSIFLAIYRLRFAELERIDLDAYTHGRSQILNRLKGSRDLILDPVPDWETDVWQRVDPQTPICLVSYDTLSHDLAYARDVAGVSLQGTHLDRTHIFRHIHATVLARAGCPVEQIAVSLGHHSPESTLAYIHDHGLVPPVLIV